MRWKSPQEFHFPFGTSISLFRYPHPQPVGILIMLSLFELFCFFAFKWSAWRLAWIAKCTSTINAVFFLPPLQNNNKINGKKGNIKSATSTKETQINIAVWWGYWSDFHLRVGKPRPMQFLTAKNAMNQSEFEAWNCALNAENACYIARNSIQHGCLLSCKHAQRTHIRIKYGGRS